MLTDTEIEQNMQLYLNAMTQKYNQSKQKIKQLQNLLNSSAKKIQSIYRYWIKRKKNISARKVQHWWRKIMDERRMKLMKVCKFRRLYFGIIVLNFFKKCHSKKSVSKNIVKKQNKTHSNQIISKTVCHQTHRYIKAVIQYFNTFIQKKSALIAQQKYIAKYREYLRIKFNQDWQKYQKKLSRQLLQQIEKKWVKITPKTKNNQNPPPLFYNTQDKQINADTYIKNKLDKIYQQNYQKLQQTQNNLINNQTSITIAIYHLENNYHTHILKCFFGQ